MNIIERGLRKVVLSYFVNAEADRNQQDYESGGRAVVFLAPLPIAIRGGRSRFDEKGTE